MRFVSGLIAGVGLVLFVAAMLPPAPSKATSLAAGTTTAAAAPATAAAETTPAESLAPDGLDAADAVQPGSAKAPAADDPAPEDMADAAVDADDREATPGSGGAPPATAPAASAALTAASPPETPADEAPAASVDALDAVPSTTAPTAVPLRAASGGSSRSEPASGRLSVWRPFHSEASAEGFARRLSTQLGHPFTVVRVAAAEYHVIFDYTDSSERELLKRQIATVTGRLP